MINAYGDWSGMFKTATEFKVINLQASLNESFKSRWPNLIANELNFCGV